MKEIKLVFTGSMGAGKTTAISAISEIPVINTDVRATDDARQRKETTTVALDYGEVTLEDGQKLRLYGTPGQERFSFMWKILMEGALGVILLVDNAGKDPIKDLAMYIEYFRPMVEDNMIVVGITRMDLAPEPQLQIYHEYLATQELFIPVFSIDARNSEHISMLIQSLVAMLEYG